MEDKSVEIYLRGRRFVRLRRQRDRLRRLRPFAADNRGSPSWSRPSWGEAVERCCASPAPGRRSPDDDPATTAYPGCMRQAVDNLSAGGLVGLDVDFAYWSRWYLLVASRLMGSLNGGARSASTAVSMPAPWSQSTEQKLVPDRSVTLPLLASHGQRLRSLSGNPPPAAGDSLRRPRGPSHRVSNSSVSKNLPTRGREGYRQRSGHVPVATRGPWLGSVISHPAVGVSGRIS